MRPRIIRHPQAADPALFELPGVQIRVAKALATIQPGSAPPTCKHQRVQRLAGLHLCAQHPERLRCATCMYRHASGHNDQAELACDACDRVPNPPLLKPLAVVRWITVSTGSGGQYVLPVTIGSLGVCRKCRGAEAA